VEQKLATRKSPQPAGWKDCATDSARFRFMSSVYAARVREAEVHGFGKT